MLVSYSFPDSIISEQFRMIQTNIKFSVAGDSRTFLITSAEDGDGKSITAANLAVSMAQQKERVLLIDANLRDPSLHYYFKISNDYGLTDFLTGRLPIEDVIYQTEIGRLDILTSGPYAHNPVELLGSNKMKELLNSALQTYNYILVDSSALLNVPDTKLLANQCDGVVLVVQNGKTKGEKAFEARKVLEFAKAQLIGFIMNQ
ncbi:CpsD/CapB family tyrosine-protein kinase [Neobacillus cucumis]|uniref:CpsD/CapB family tyrosine-protein kinase n=1 Tax=Neobacillus cucumis TaxID=1740721 RepID=UPI001962DE9B|nr:CpsD/CapB family tyrosine-protein kinase [Neobacillus cucumis]MBM7651868.1 capsular exopolysaccharide synthesis family protein [Neobacillus cucumis]